jgi:hypothetical protein
MATTTQGTLPLSSDSALNVITFASKARRFLSNPIDAWRWRYRWPRFLSRLAAEEERNKVFDRRYGVDTAEELPLEEAGVDVADLARGNSFYRGVWEPEFHHIMRDAGLRFKDFTFVDYGSGKGKVLLMAALYAFKRIIGIEYAPVLHNIAERNISVFHDENQRCPLIESVRGDATAFEPPSGPLVCFFFNPFDVETTRTVFQKLRVSFQHAPRDIYLIYVNLRHIRENEAVYAGADWLQLVKRDYYFIIYRIAA